MLALPHAYRGFAALLVVLYHTGGALQEVFGRVGALTWFDFGGSGVQFFFVLSGFIILWNHAGDIGHPERLRSYATKRVVRIYPVYLFVCLLLAPAWLLVPSFGEPYHKDGIAFLQSLLLWPQEHLPHLGVAWTLTHEMVFYSFFAILIVASRWGWAVLSVWFIAIAAMIGTRVAMPASYLLSPNNLLFALGMIAAYVLKRKPTLRGNSASFILGNVAFIATGLFYNRLHVPSETLGPVTSALFVLAFGAASFAILLHSLNPALQSLFATSRTLSLLGDASYSIYLIHYPVISLSNKMLALIDVRLPAPIAFIVIATGATIAGVLLHLWVEKPLLTFIRGRIRKPSLALSSHSSQNIP